MSLLHDDRALVIYARALRTFGYGCTSVLLIGLLEDDGIAGWRLGLILAAAAAGCVLATIGMGMYADRFGRRSSLMLSACLMGVAGLAFAVSESYAVLLAAAFIGTVSPSTNDNTPFSSVEQVILAQRTPEARHAAMFTRYNVTAQAAGAVGGLAAAALGMLPRSLAGDAAFAGYSMVAFGTGFLFARLSPEAEAPRRVTVRGAAAAATGRAAGALVAADATTAVAAALDPIAGDAAIASPVAADAAAPHPVAADASAAESAPQLSAHRSPTTRLPAAIRRLACLFAVDAFAGGLAVQAILAWWFRHRFGATTTDLGLVFFAANLLPALAQLLAPRLVSRHGLLPAMLVPHLASNVFLACIPLANDLPTAVVLLLARQALSKIDVPARQAFTATLVGPEHRTAATSATTAARGIAVSASPLAASLLLTGPLTVLGAPLLAGAALAVVYDIAIWRSFRSAA